MSAFSEVVDAVVAVLSSAPSLANQVVAEEVRQVADSTRTLINVYWKSALPEEAVVNGPSDWQLQLCIDALARSKSQSGGKAVDDMMIHIVDRISADSTLGGLVIDCGLPRIDLEFDEAGQKTGWVQLTYIVKIRTNHRSVRYG